MILVKIIYMKKVILSTIIIITMVVLVVGLEFVINNQIGNQPENLNLKNEVFVNVEDSQNFENQKLIVVETVNSKSNLAQDDSNTPTTLRKMGNRFIDLENPENVFTRNEVRMVSNNQGILNNQRVIII